MELGCSVCILGHYVFVRCLVDIVVALILKHANKNCLGAIGTGTGKAPVVLDNHCDGYPPMTHSRGYSTTREEAMMEFKAQWLSSAS